MFSLAKRYMLTTLVLVLVGGWTPSNASSATSILFYCPTSCKIYLNGDLLFSLQNGGVKQSLLPTGLTATVLISRPGKPDWVRSITPTRPLSINPDQSNPTVIPDDAGGPPSSTLSNDPLSSATTGSNQAEAPETNQKAHPIPSWLNGFFELNKSDEKKRLQIKSGSHSCPVDVEMNLTLSDGSTLEYSQDMSMDDLILNGNLSDPRLDWCANHFEEPEFDQNWKFYVPINLTRVSDDLLTFSGDLSHCSEYDGPKAGKCKLPPGTSQITGHLRRSGSGVTVEFEDPLNATFELELYKGRAN